jgi:glycosyltransferase involved in cell wall biosynthesis
MTQRKRIAVCTAQIPFEHGGAEIHAESLVDELRKRDYQVEYVRVPFRWYPKEEILKGYLAWRLLDLTESEGRPIDQVIALKYPSFVIQHPNKVVWLIQQFRQAYELFDTRHSHFKDTPADRHLREIIRRADTQTLGEARRLFTTSRNLAGRLDRFNGLEAEILPCPPQFDGQYRSERYEDYVLVVSRLTRWKRNDLVVKAMAHTRSNARLMIAGRGPEKENLEGLAHQYGLQDRVKLLGYVDDDTLLDLYANCFAVFYGPLDEDYGLATVEAFKSQKPVITMSDSGGVLEFVDEGRTGHIVDPGEATDLAERIDELHADRQRCRRMGMEGYRRVEHINWDQTIRSLVTD